MLIKCRICGEFFNAKNGNARYCSKQCKNKAKLNALHERKLGLGVSSKKEAKKVNKELVDISVKARELGMSYGQYVAMMEMGAK